MELNNFFKAATDDIRSKPELQGLSQEFVLTQINESYRKLPPSIQKKLLQKIEQIEILSSPGNITRTKEYALLFKACRKRLRLQHGMFEETAPKKRTEKKNILDRLKNAKTTQEVESLSLKILQGHRSSTERLKEYSAIYSFCFAGLPKKKNVLDLGGGNNSASFVFWPKGEAITYLCYDISEEYAQLAEMIGKRSEQEVHGRVVDLAAAVREGGAMTLREHIVHDARALGITLPFDVCFLWKVVDVLEKQQRGTVQRLFSLIPAKMFVVSFPTKSLGQKKRIPPSARRWFVNFLKWNQYAYETFETENELFLRVVHKE